MKETSAIKKEIELSEEEVLQARLINTQLSLVNVSLENLELKKQMLLMDKQNMGANLADFKKEVSKKNEINYDDYTLDLTKKKLVKIK